MRKFGEHGPRHGRFVRSGIFLEGAVDMLVSGRGILQRSHENTCGAQVSSRPAGSYGVIRQRALVSSEGGARVALQVPEVPVKNPLVTAKVPP